MLIPFEEHLCRKFLWVNHGCEGDCLYGDDGEMQCNSTLHGPIDFKRDSVIHIFGCLAKITKAGIQEFQELKEEADEPKL